MSDLSHRESGYVQGSLKWAIAFTASLGAILEVIDTSIVNVALTNIQASLGATVSEVGWIVAGYAIANVILIPLSAWLGDFFGKKSYFSAGSGFYNLTRQLGGSIGIALLTTMLQQREAFHKATLLENVSLYSPETTQWLDALTGAFQSQGSDAVTAQQQALLSVEQLVNLQEAVLSYADIFRFIGVMFLCSLPLLLFLGKGGAGAKAPLAE